MGRRLGQRHWGRLVARGDGWGLGMTMGTEGAMLGLSYPLLRLGRATVQRKEGSLGLFGAFCEGVGEKRLKVNGLSQLGQHANVILHHIYEPRNELTDRKVRLLGQCLNELLVFLRQPDCQGLGFRHTGFAMYCFVLQR